MSFSSGASSSVSVMNIPYKCLIPVLLSANILCLPIAQAIPFGYFDARSVAMGGVGVASATSANAVFYNPAMLARYKVRKEKGNNSRFIFPTISARVSLDAEDLEDFRTNDIDSRLDSAINAFDRNNAATVNDVVNIARELQSDLNDISSSPLLLDGNVGMVLGIGHRRQGGSLMINRRIVADGKLNQSAEDRQLLNAYIDDMSFIASNGAQGAPHPEIYIDGNRNNQLIPDQIDNLTSNATASGLLITELGISMSWEVTAFDYLVALGVTPKFVQVVTYDSNATATDNNIESNRDEDDSWKMTADIGMAKAFDEKIRWGVVIKNIIPLDYKTALGNTISVKPQVRAGAAYELSWGRVAADLDILKNKAIGSGGDSQELGLGLEWDFKRWLQLRGGYNYNLAGEGDGSKGLMSAGLHFSAVGFTFDIGYADNGDSLAAGLQLGYRF